MKLLTRMASVVIAIASTIAALAIWDKMKAPLN